jgi:hypothetical protein
MAASSPVVAPALVAGADSARAMRRECRSSPYW